MTRVADSMQLMGKHFRRDLFQVAHVYQQTTDGTSAPGCRIVRLGEGFGLVWLLEFRTDTRLGKFRCTETIIHTRGIDVYHCRHEFKRLVLGADWPYMRFWLAIAKATLQPMAGLVLANWS
jgi:hypothetical protein